MKLRDVRNRENAAGQKVRCYFVQGFPFVIEYK